MQFLNDWTLGIHQMLGGIPIIVQISKILSWLGIGYLYYLLSAYLILKKDPRGKLLWYYWTSAAILNAILKYTFAQPRPYWVEPQIQAFEKSISFGMPSGHAQSACGILLMCLIYRLGWFWGLTWMLMISLARVILGVHSFAQVLVGLGLGVGMVLIFYFRHNDMFRFLKNKSIQWALVIVTFIYGIIAIRLGAETIEQVSQAWVNAPTNMKDSFKISSLFVPFGFLSAFLLAQSQNRFLPRFEISKVSNLSKWENHGWFVYFELLALFICAWLFRLFFIFVFSKMAQFIPLETVFFKGFGDLSFCLIIGFYLGRK